jgi:hypothetical protein
MAPAQKLGLRQPRSRMPLTTICSSQCPHNRGAVATSFVHMKPRNPGMNPARCDAAGGGTHETACGAPPAAYNAAETMFTGRLSVLHATDQFSSLLPAHDMAGLAPACLQPVPIGTPEQFFSEYVVSRKPVSCGSRLCLTIWAGGHAGTSRRVAQPPTGCPGPSCRRSLAP